MKKFILFNLITAGAIMIFILAGCSVEKTAPPTFSPDETHSSSPLPTAMQSPSLAHTAIPSLHTSAPIIQLTDLPTLVVPVTSIVVSTTPAVFQPDLLGMMAFVNDTGITIARSDGTTINTILFPSDLTITHSISWSPDGHKLAIDAVMNPSPTTSHSEIYTVNADGSGLTRLTFAPYFKSDVSWSPDGKYLLYSETVSDEQNDIVRLNVEDGGLLKLTYTPYAEVSPAWSPNGRSIAFLYYEYKRNEPYATELYMMHADGSNRRRVSDLPAIWGGISWSPNGNQIAFSSPRSQDPRSHDYCDIYKVNVDGSGLTRLTNLPGCAYAPVWISDGQHIAFKYVNFGENDWWHPNIYMINTDGGELTRWATKKNWEIIAFAISPVPSLLIGRNYQITEAGANINLRQEPATDSMILKQIKAGEIVTILDGPVDKDYYYWWHIRTADGLDGWSVEVMGWYSLVEKTFTPDP